MEDFSATTEYPIATDRLNKGDSISVETIERAFGVRRETDAYRLALLRAADYVAQRFRDRGEIVTIIERKRSLVILTDEQASAYNAERFNIELRGAARAHARMLGADRANMSETVRTQHDQTLVNQGRILGAVRRERALIAKAHRRSLPVPPGAK